jgi:hypothetical protein
MIASTTKYYFLLGYIVDNDIAHYLSSSCFNFVLTICAYRLSNSNPMRSEKNKETPFILFIQYKETPFIYLFSCWPPTILSKVWRRCRFEYVTSNVYMFVQIAKEILYKFLTTSWRQNKHMRSFFSSNTSHMRSD